MRKVGRKSIKSKCHNHATLAECNKVVVAGGKKELTVNCNKRNKQTESRFSLEEGGKKASSVETSDKDREINLHTCCISLEMNVFCRRNGIEMLLKFKTKWPS